MANVVVGSAVVVVTAVVEGAVVTVAVVVSAIVNFMFRVRLVVVGQEG